MLAFYHMAYSTFFVPAIALNVSMQVSYYLFRNRYMFNKNVKLFSLVRVLLAYGAIAIGHEEIIIKKYL